MKIGIPWGVHGLNEPLSIAFGQSAETYWHGNDNLIPIRGNRRAIMNGGRYDEENMAVSLLYPNAKSPIYERREAARMLAECAMHNFDLILDIHQSPYDHSTYAGVSPGAPDALLAVLSYLGFKELMVGHVGMYAQYPATAAAVELAQRPGVSTADIVDDMRNKIEHLAAYESLEAFSQAYNKPVNLRAWAYGDVILTAEVDLDTALALNCAKKGYMPITDDEKAVLGLSHIEKPVHSLNFGRKCSDMGYVGEYIFPLGWTAQSPGWRENARRFSNKTQRWHVPVKT